MIISNYSEGNLKKYNSKNPLKQFFIKRLHRKIISAVKTFSQNNSSLFVLDAGCGEGFVSHSLNNAVSEIKTLGVEYTNEALEIAKKSFPSYSFEQGDVTALSYPDGYFDVAVCSEVLEHLKQPEKALCELLRVSKKGVVITVPHEPFFCISNMLSLNHLKTFGNPEGHINHWTRRSFNHFIANGVTKSRITIQINRGGAFNSFPWIGVVIRKE